MIDHALQRCESEAQSAVGLVAVACGLLAAIESAEGRRLLLLDRLMGMSPMYTAYCRCKVLPDSAMGAISVIESAASGSRGKSGAHARAGVGAASGGGGGCDGRAGAAARPDRRGGGVAGASPARCADGPGLPCSVKAIGLAQKLAQKLAQL